MIQKITEFVIDFVSTLLNPSRLPVCRFEPSCSHFAKHAIRAHGLLRGVPLVAGRLLRCRPGGPSGIDPVPFKE